MATIPTEKTSTTTKPQVADHAQRNFTDPESRIMPYQNTFVQAYNAQIAVDSAHQIIVATELTNAPKDDAQLPHMIRLLPRKAMVLSADAGYSSPRNLRFFQRYKRIDAYIACGREPRHGSADGSGTPSPRGPIPDSFTLKDRMRRKLRTQRGIKLYARRKAIAEPPFGHIKHVLGFRQFSLRGYHKCRAEWFLVAAVVNMRKLFSASPDLVRRSIALQT